MKIHVDVDATPEELRTFFGLPDVQELQDEWMERLREQIGSGKPLDPAALAQVFSAPLAGMEAWQKLVLEAMRRAAKPGNG